MNRFLSGFFAVFFGLTLLVSEDVCAQAKKKKDLRPKSSSEFFSFGDEAELEEITDQSIEELQSLIQRFSKSKNRGELWLRLAELYVEKARLTEFRAFRKLDRENELFAAGKRKRRPKVNLSQSKNFSRKAVGLYEKFVRQFPNDPRVDQALFFLGFNYFSLNQSQKGAVFYRQLSQNHRSSPYIAESNFALAEYHFENEEWAKAKKYYQAVASNKSARLYLFSLYKMAWCEYRMGRIKTALGSLVKVLKESRRRKRQSLVAGRKKINRIRLASESARDIVPFYAESRKPAKSAYSFFVSIAGENVGLKMLEKLAYYYSDTGQVDNARIAFKSLIRKNPSSESAFDYQYQIVNNLLYSRRIKLLKSEMLTWIRKYGEDSSWWRRNQDNEKLISDAAKLRESTLRNYILQVHQTAKNSRQPFSQNAALEGYVLYKKFFPDSKQRSLMQFYHAELLFDMKKYEKAHAEYSWVIKKGSKSGYFEPAVINSAIAMEKSLPKENVIRKRVGKSNEPVEFSSKIKKFSESAELYKKTFPKGEKYVPITFKLARLYYLHNQFDKALEGFQEVVDRQPKSKLGEYSANLILDIYHLKKDYAGLKKAGQSLLDKGISAKVGGEVKGLIERSAFKTANELESSGDHLGAAKSYRSFANQNPKSKLAPGAVFNSAVNFKRAGDLRAASQMFAAYIAIPKGTNKKLLIQAEESLPKLLVDTGQYEKAARRYEALAKKYPRSKKLATWQFNAAIIWHDLKSWNKALRSYAAYEKKERKKEKEEALFQIAEIWRERRNNAMAARYYRRYIARSPSSADKLLKSHYYLAELSQKMKKNKDAENSHKKVVQLGKFFLSRNVKVDRELVGKSMLYLANKFYYQYINIKFPKQVKRQRRAINSKISSLDVLKKEFSKVIKFGSKDQVVASFVVLGRAHWHMYNFFYKIPIPKGLDKAQRKEYKKQIAKQTMPFKKSAISYFKEAIEYSENRSAYNNWVLSARRELTSIEGKKYRFYDEKIYSFEEKDWMQI